MAEDTDMPDTRPGLFHEVVFHIVISDKLPRSTANELRNTFTDHGAVEAQHKPVSSLSRVSIDLEEVTHIVAADTDFQGYADAEALMIPVVRPEWVSFSVKVDRLAHVRPFTPDPRFFFSDVVATVAELPPGDKEAICGGIIAMGGQYSNHLTKLTTHIVALSTDNEKCRQAEQKRLRVKIVLPHWFDDCLKLGRRIDEGPYQHPNPEIERVDSAAHLAIPSGLDLTYTHAHEGGPMSDGPPTLRESYNIFHGKKVMLGSDLCISSRLRQVLEGIIEQTQGAKTNDVEKTDVYVGQWREGDEYIQASQRFATAGNLTWLYWMFAHGEWTSPMNRLLHYPTGRGGIPGMRDKVITVSNYGGDARLYLENLIEACGAKFTKSMKADNTHLITARAHSEKCTAAREWNIHMVNHLWLEETYAKWKIMSITDPKYTHFPRRTNLMEVVGQTRIDTDTIEQFYNLEDASPEKPRRANGSAGRTATMQTGSNTPTPAKRRHTTYEEDSPAPPSTGRKAKERATARLHDTIMPDVALYQKEMKRKGGVMGGKSRAGSADSPSEKSLVGRKRSKSEESEDDSLATKKNKKRPPKPTISLLITAYTGWLDKPHKEDAEKKILANLGVKCVEDPGQCNYLAAPSLVRTEKFCCAIARAPVAVTTKWVEDCINEERILDTEPYLLKDPEGEKRLNVKLSTSLVRAKENDGKLLEGQTVYCTPGVHGGYEVCRRIVEANGGVCILFKGPKRPANAPDSKRVVMLSGDGSADRKLWPKFQGMAHNSGRKCSIYKSDWILEMAMSQKLDWSGRHSLTPSR